MNIISRVRNFFSFSSEPIHSTPTDKWGDPWINDVEYQGRKPSLAELQRRNSFKYNKCPHCGQEDLRIGPQGMGSINYLCASCGSKFNDGGVFGVDLLRDCTNPIPEMDKEATHDHNGSIVIVEPVREITDRRGAIAAQKSKKKGPEHGEFYGGDAL